MQEILNIAEFNNDEELATFFPDKRKSRMIVRKESMIANPYVLKKEKEAPTPFLQESWFEASFDNVYSNLPSITPRKSSRVDENRSLTVVKVQKTARCKQIEEESRLDPFNMREYRELINYSVRKNNHVVAAPYSPKKEWHIKIKSSKAFYP